MYGMAQTLAGNPERLRVLAPYLRDVVGVAAAPGRLTSADLLAGLWKRMRPFGVR